MGKSNPNNRGADSQADAPAHRSDEFPAGYSLTRCSPAELVSALPAGIQYVSELGQVRGSLNATNRGNEQLTGQ